jgi:hypothetical protein
VGAHRRYPDPLTQLRALATEARDHGQAFEEFWREAVERRPFVMTTTRNPPPGALRWPTDGDARTAWAAVFEDEAVIETWRRAYEGEPPLPSERALVALAGLLTANADRALAVPIAA